LSTVLKYNFEGSVLYSSIIFGEYSWLYSSTFERQILYSLLRSAPHNQLLCYLCNWRNLCLSAGWYKK